MLVLDPGQLCYIVDRSLEILFHFSLCSLAIQVFVGDLAPLSPGMGKKFSMKDEKALEMYSCLGSLCCI